jgi:hypothetical protein
VANVVFCQADAKAFAEMRESRASETPAKNLNLGISITYFLTPENNVQVNKPQSCDNGSVNPTRLANFMSFAARF